MFQNWLEVVPKTSQVIVTFFHGNFGDGPEIDSNLKFLIQNQSRIRIVVTSNTAMKERLVGLGLHASKIVVIPIGVDASVFYPRADSERLEIRSGLHLPTDRFVMGSFQKDGVGWGAGMSPKLIKGPDVLVETARLLNKKIPTFVLLSGPSRGYVKQKLSEYGVPFKHIQLTHSSQVANLYQAVDSYVISSREEGGPKGLLEATSSGCPVVTTPVGMANDLTHNNEFLKVSKGFEPTELAANLAGLANRKISFFERTKFSRLVEHCAWMYVGKLHWELAYSPLLPQKRQ